MSAQLSEIRSVPLLHVFVSDSGAQTERRKRFDKAAIEELAESLKAHGLLQPILVRPHEALSNGEPTYELVAGERRVLAARKAGFTEIAANVRDLTDQQVLEVQLIENLQREGLHELIEAEGYEALMKRHGYTVEDLVAKVGKSKGYVYARLKLTSLGKEGRKAFYAGEITASLALLVARIPAELQKEALEQISDGDYGDGPMSYREAQRFVHDRYMLKLGGAGFPTSDATLLPAAGACGTCPKRTGNNPDLFGDVKGADVCTDPVCFKAKRAAHAERLVANARAAGRTVIEGKEAKKISRYGGTQHLEGGYVALDERCYDDSKNRTYRQLLGKKEAEISVLVVPGGQDNDEDAGSVAKVVEIVPRSALKGLIKERRESGGDDSWRAQRRTEDKRLKRESAWRLELVKRLQVARAAKRSRSPHELDLNELEFVLRSFYDRLDNDAQSRIAKVWGVEATKGRGGYGREFKLPLSKPGEAAALLLDCVYARDLYVPSYSKDGPKRILEACKRYGVDAEKVKRELLAAEKAKGKKKSTKPK